MYAKFREFKMFIGADAWAAGVNGPNDLRAQVQHWYYYCHIHQLEMLASNSCGKISSYRALPVLNFKVAYNTCVTC
jgi:hypothetical protein